MFSYTPYRIPFSETDAMGIVHHSYYTRYFERGRVEFLRQIEILYRELADHGIHFPVLSVESSFRRPLRFDDQIVIETRISLLSKTRLNFEYRILKRDDEKYRMQKTQLDAKLDVATIGSSEHCCLAPDGKPQRIPDELLKKFNKYYSPKASDGDDQIEKRN